MKQSRYVFDIEDTTKHSGYWQNLYYIVDNFVFCIIKLHLKLNAFTSFSDG